MFPSSTRADSTQSQSGLLLVEKGCPYSPMPAVASHIRALVQQRQAFSSRICELCEAEANSATVPTSWWRGKRQKMRDVRVRFFSKRTSSDLQNYDGPFTCGFARALEENPADEVLIGKQHSHIAHFLPLTPPPACRNCLWRTQPQRHRPISTNDPHKITRARNL